MNPGSPTFPRGSQRPTIGRIFVDDVAQKIVDAKIIQLGEKDSLPTRKVMSGLFSSKS